MKRRAFLKSASGSLALAGIGLQTALAADDFRWSQANASALVGQSFWLNHPELGAVALTLTAVRTPAQQPEPRLQQFSLVFSAAAGTAIASGTYDMEHAALGAFALHLAPAGSEGNAALYRSDFTLLA